MVLHRAVYMYVKARVVHRTMLVAFSKYPVLRLI